MDVSRLESRSYDPGLRAGAGGVIVYRLEVFDPRASRTRFFDRRFRYKRQGHPATGTYRLCTTLTEEPSVDCVTHHSAQISWETDRASRGAVLLDGTEVKDERLATRHEVSVTGLQPDRRYRYQIRYAAAGGLTGKQAFRTAPAPGSQCPFSFGFISDSRGGVGGGERSVNGVNRRDLTHFVTTLYARGARFICFAGDLINGYTSEATDFVSQLESWKRAVQPVAARIPVYEGMGNHEQLGDFYRVPDPAGNQGFLLLFADREGDESAEAYFAREFVNPPGSAYGFGPPAPETRIAGVAGPRTGPSYAENVYSFRYGNAHFVALNTNYWYTGQRRAPGSSRSISHREATLLALEHLGGNREGYLRPHQLAWLERDLRAAQADDSVDWVFIYLHEPAFPNGGHLQDAMFWATPGKGEAGGLNDPSVPLGDVIDMRDRFWRTVADHPKVLAVLCGDEHNYSRTRVDSAIRPDYRSPVWQIVSGGCGAPYYVQDTSVPWSENVERFAASKHCCLFTVAGDRVSLTVISDTSEVLDHVDDLTTIKENRGLCPGAGTAQLGGEHGTAEAR
jgi:hypothetical protein